LKNKSLRGAARAQKEGKKEKRARERKMRVN